MNPSSDSVVSFSLGQLHFLAALLNKLGDQSRPSGLVARSDAGAIVAVKVLMEIDEVAPVWIVLKFLEPAIDRPMSIFGTQKNSRQSTRNLRGPLPQRGLPARTGRQLNREAVPVKVMKFLERFDQQEIDGKPYWSAPVGVSPEQRSAGLGGVIVHAMLCSVYMQDVGIAFVESRDRSNTMWREKFGFIQKAAKHAFQLAAVHQGKEATQPFVRL